MLNVNSESLTNEKSEINLVNNIINKNDTRIQRTPDSIEDKRKKYSRFIKKTYKDSCEKRGKYPKLHESGDSFVSNQYNISSNICQSADSSSMELLCTDNPKNINYHRDINIDFEYPNDSCIVKDIYQDDNWRGKGPELPCNPDNNGNCGIFDGIMNCIGNGLEAEEECGQGHKSGWGPCCSLGNALTDWTDRGPNPGVTPTEFERNLFSSENLNCTDGDRGPSFFRQRFNLCIKNDSNNGISAEELEMKILNAARTVCSTQSKDGEESRCGDDKSKYCKFYESNKDRCKTRKYHSPSGVQDKYDDQDKYDLSRLKRRNTNTKWSWEDSTDPPVDLTFAGIKEHS